MHISTTFKLSVENSSDWLFQPMHVDDLSRLPADPSLFQSMHTSTMFKLSVENSGDWLCFSLCMSMISPDSRLIHHCFSLCASIPCLSSVLRTAVTVFQSVHTSTMFKLSVENSGDWLCFSLCTSMISPDSQLICGGFEDSSIQLWRLQPDPLPTAPTDCSNSSIPLAADYIYRDEEERRVNMWVELAGICAVESLLCLCSDRSLLFYVFSAFAEKEKNVACCIFCCGKEGTFLFLCPCSQPWHFVAGQEIRLMKSEWNCLFKKKKICNKNDC